MRATRRLFEFLAVALAAVFFAGCATPGPESSFKRELQQHPDRGVLLRDVPDISHGKAEGNAAALTDILHFWNIDIPLDQVDRDLKDAVPDLSSDDELSAYVAPHGLVTFATPGSLERLKTCLMDGIPSMVQLQESPRAARRTSVVVGFDDDARMVVLHEGARTPHVLPYDEFLAQWNSAASWMRVICPPERPTWALSPGEFIARAHFYNDHMEFQKAAADYDGALQQDPRNLDLCIVLANLYRQLGRDGDAESLYRRAMDINPLNGRASNNLAFILAENGRSLDEALRLARRSTLLEPSNAVALDTLGYVYLAQGQFGEASSVLERARSRARNLPVHMQNEIAMHLVLAQFRNGQPHLARQVLGDILHADPSYPVPPELSGLREPQTVPGHK